jgi:hypothetical protein
MKRYRKRFVIVHRSRTQLIEPGIHWAHNAPGGRLLLKTQISWRTISGIILRAGSLVVWLYFRRRPTL